MRWLKYTLFFINHFILSINAQDFSVGTCRDHLPYSEFNQVVQVGNFFYASTPYSIVEFDNYNNEKLGNSIISNYKFLHTLNIIEFIFNNTRNFLKIKSSKSGEKLSWIRKYNSLFIHTWK